MKHFRHVHDNHFGVTHSFTGTVDEMLKAIEKLVKNGVAFRYQPTDLDHLTITHISDESYQKLMASKYEKKDKDKLFDQRKR